MIEQKDLLTEDGVDVTTMIGKRLWYSLHGGLDSFEVVGIDFTVGDDGTGTQLRVYGNEHGGDREPWLRCSETRAKPRDWAVNVYRERMDKIVKNAAENGAIIRYTIEAEQ